MTYKNQQSPLNLYDENLNELCKLIRMERENYRLEKENKMNNVVEFKPQVEVINNEVFTTSKNIAEVFGKTHKHVIRDIEGLDIPEEFNKSNFGLISYKDSMNRNRKLYNITRDGMTLLIMGYTGSKAMQFKLQYIEAFNQMEKTLLENAQNIQTDIHPLVTALEAMINKQVCIQVDKQIRNKTASSETKALVKNKTQLLIDELTAYRNKQAEEQEVPHYMVLRKETIQELAKKQPKRRDSLRNIKHMGEKRFTRYGEDILKIIKAA